MSLILNNNFIGELRNLGLMRIVNDFKTEKKFTDINPCNKTICHEYCTNEGKLTFSKETIFELSKPGMEEPANELGTNLTDKNIMAENFVLDFKFKSQDEMENQERLTCKKDFNSENDGDNLIYNGSEDSETLTIYYDESDIDSYTSDNETIKDIDETANDGSSFEKRLDNREIYSEQQNCTNSNTCEINAKIPYEYYDRKTDGLHMCNCEDDFKKSSKDLQLANIRNENISNEINGQKNNFSHISHSNEDFQSSIIEQELHNTEHEDPDVLKIFYDESDIDSDYKSDSEISGKSEEIKIIKPEINENCKLSVNKEVCDHDLSVSNNAVSSYINLLNYISEDNNEVKSQLNSSLATETIQSTENMIPDNYEDNSKEKSLLNSSLTSETIQSTENTISDYYEEEKEDLMNPGWNKIKSLSTDNERCNVVAECWQSPSVSDPNKNLTYYSFRKRFLCSEEDGINQRRPIKRKASSSLNDQDAKRARLCTYIADNRIKSIEDERNLKIEELKQEFDLKIKENFANYRSLENRRKQQHLYLYGTMRNYEKINGAELKRIKNQFKREASILKVKYGKKFKGLQHQYITKLNSSYKKRKEILEFCNFYKITKTDSGRAPTLLTSDQQLILNEIENIYKQLDVFYSS